MSVLDWRSMPESNSKRHAYYASREWAEKREQVKERSGGICERCCLLHGDQVHHQTYERLYRENLSDLLFVCRPCHAFISAKSPHDPIVVARDTTDIYDASQPPNLTANREGEEPWRIPRLARAFSWAATNGNHPLLNVLIVEMHDSKGDLTVSSWRSLTAKERQLMIDAWASEAECVVDFIDHNDSAFVDAVRGYCEQGIR